MVEPSQASEESCHQHCYYLMHACGNVIRNQGGEKFKIACFRSSYNFTAQGCKVHKVQISKEMQIRIYREIPKLFLAQI